MLYSKDLTVSMCHFSLTFLIHIGCICLTFLHCAFSKFSSNCLTEKIHSHIGCIRLAFLRCAFSNVSSNCLPGKMHSHIDCICLTFLRCSFSNVSWEDAKWHWSHLFNFSPLCVFKCVLKLPVRNDANSHWLHLFHFFLCEFSNVSSNGLPEKMHSHIGHIYLIFSTVCFLMCIQNVCPRRGKVTFFFWKERAYIEFHGGCT